MGKRTPNPRLAKTYRTYTVDEIATLYGVHKNTVLGWRDAGLEPIDDHRKPLLFLGRVLADFLAARRVKNKRPLRPGQIYCVACHDAKEPALGMAEYQPLTTTSGNLSGFCPTCEIQIYRRVSRVKLDAVAASLDVTIADAGSRIKDEGEASVNSDLQPSGKP